MKAIKRAGYTLFVLLFFYSSIIAAAYVRNVEVAGQCYTAGQLLTVSFEVRTANAWQNIYGDILFSDNPAAEYTDDAVWCRHPVSGVEGPQDPPVNTGHDGGFVAAQGSDVNVWHKRSYVVKAPQGITGPRYIIVNVAENYMQLWNWGHHIESSAFNITSQCQTTPIFTPTVDANIYICEVITVYGRENCPQQDTQEEYSKAVKVSSIPGDTYRIRLIEDTCINYGVTYGETEGYMNLY
ncbi:MAG TPA: hypothetical protein ENN43_03295, partial [bacterium]|nr:hypothetical protein [bacterium]